MKNMSLGQSPGYTKKRAVGPAWYPENLKKHHFQQMPFFCSPENQKNMSDPIKSHRKSYPRHPGPGAKHPSQLLGGQLEFPFVRAIKFPGLGDGGQLLLATNYNLDVGMDLWNEIFQKIHQDFCEITGIIKKWVQSFQSSRGFYGKNV